MRWWLTQRDPWRRMWATTLESDNLTPLRKSLHLTSWVVVSEHDPCVEDVCGPSHLPRYQHVEELSGMLVEFALEEGKLTLSEAMRQRITSGRNKQDLRDRSIQHFDSLYSACWGNTMFGRTKGDLGESSLMLKLKFSKRYSATNL